MAGDKKHPAETMEATIAADIDQSPESEEQAASQSRSGVADEDPLSAHPT